MLKVQRKFTSANCNCDDASGVPLTQPLAPDTVLLPQEFPVLWRLYAKSNEIYQFAQLLFDTDEVARHVTPILKAILDAQSGRQSEIAPKMRGNFDANYKHLQVLIRRVRQRFKRMVQHPIRTYV